MGLWLSHDELNEFGLQWNKGKPVVTTGNEREAVAEGGMVGRVQRVHTARRTYSMGLVLSPLLGVLQAYIVVKNLAPRKLALIKKRFGSLVSVCANATGSMRSETHVRFFLNQVMEKATLRARPNLVQRPGCLLNQWTMKHTVPL